MRKNLKSKSDIILIKKRSEDSFLETMIPDSLLGVIYFLFRRKKYDYLVLIKASIVKYYKNKLFKTYQISSIDNLYYCLILPSLKLKNDDKFKISLTKFRITYEESQKIKQDLELFKQQLSS